VPAKLLCPPYLPVSFVDPVLQWMLHRESPFGGSVFALGQRRRGQGQGARLFRRLRLPGIQAFTWTDLLDAGNALRGHLDPKVLIDPFLVDLCQLQAWYKGRRGFYKRTRAEEPDGIIASERGDHFCGDKVRFSERETGLDARKLDRKCGWIEPDRVNDANLLFV
jgi:hypothetical protein